MDGCRGCVRSQRVDGSRRREACLCDNITLCSQREGGVERLGNPCNII